MTAWILLTSFMEKANCCRAQKSSASMWTRITTLPIGNGLLMQSRHSLLVNSVSLPVIRLYTHIDISRF